MAIENPNELDRVDRAIRINELKHEAEDLAGGEMIAWEAEDCPDEVSEQFWRQVVDCEKAPAITPLQRLAEAGLILPPPDEVSDAEMPTTLRHLIDRMAARRMFVHSTDHLSDRELYEHLWKDSLRESMADMPMSKSAMWVIDILGSCSDEDIRLQMKHYADEETRRQWMEQSPDYEMPPHEDPPYDRDRQLPQAEFG